MRKKLTSKVKKITRKAEEYGYAPEKAEKIGKARANYSKGQAPVAKDTNKTRRKVCKPTSRCSY